MTANTLEQPDTQTAAPQPETPPEPTQWQPEKHRFGSIAILVATVAGALLALYAFRLPPFGLGEVYSHPPKASYGVASPRRTNAYCLRRRALSETFGGWL